MLKVVNLNKKYSEKQIYSNFNLEIKDGEMIAIKGASGSGKTTLIRILSMQDREFDGEYYVDDNKVSDLRDKDYNKFRLENMSVIFQDYNLIEYLSVYENIILPLKFNHKSIDKDYINELLEKFKMSDLATKKVSLISGGEAQRTAIIRAIVMKTKYIFADEPTGNLDDKNTKEVMGMLSEAKKNNVTIVMVTHSNQLDDYFDRIIRINLYD